MKKSITLLFVGIILISLTGCSNNNSEVPDALKFKEEYEILNGDKNENNGKKYRTLKINEDNSIVYKSAGEIIEMMEHNETFVVYFGFASCPWCRSVIPTLMEVSNDLELYPIYYVDVLNIRDTMVIEEKGNIVTERQGTDEYYQLLEKMDSVLESYVLINEDGEEIDTGEKRIYAPNIVSVVDGKTLKLTDGISDNQDDAYMELTDEILEESYDKIKCSIQCVVDKKKTCSSKTKC